jgi:5,10-methylenetetrahydromethanopterin reductase
MVSKLRIGLGLHTSTPVTKLIRIAEEAERSGFESLWISEDPYFRDLFPITSLIGYTTNRIIIGTGIANFYSKHPVYMAMTAATLNEICNGRFILGLGRNIRGVIEGQLGITYGEPLQYLEEYILVLRNLLSGRSLTFEGKFLKIRDVKMRIEGLPSYIKIYTSGMGPRAFQLAGRIADGIILNACSSTAHVRYAMEHLGIGAIQAGKRVEDIDVACCIWVFISDDLDEAYNSAKKNIAFLLSIPEFGELVLSINKHDTSILKDIRLALKWDVDQADPFWHLEFGDLENAASYISDDLVRKLTIVGGIKECRQRLYEYMNAGVKLPILFPLSHEYTSLFTLVEHL